jgi:hypothetical protein
MGLGQGQLCRNGPGATQQSVGGLVIKIDAGTPTSSAALYTAAGWGTPCGTPSLLVALLKTTTALADSSRQSMCTDVYYLVTPNTSNTPTMLTMPT